MQTYQKIYIYKYYPIHQSGKLKYPESTTPGNNSISNTLLETRSLYS